LQKNIYSTPFTFQALFLCITATQGMEENTNNVPTKETTSTRNLRRRTRYAQMSPERKDLLLSQLREKRAQSKRQKPLHQSNSTATLTISTSSLYPEQDAVSKPTNVPGSSTEAEHIVGCSSTFQLGIQQNRDNVLAQERTSHRNLRRRTRYAEMSSHRKELLLSQLREKRAASKRQKSLLQSNNIAALTITASLLSPVQPSKPTSLPGATTRGEHIVSCLSTFELGSTSTASHVATKLPSTCTANKGSAADGDLQEKQLSPPTPPLVNSAANGNGCAAGSGNTDFISTKKNLVNYPEVQTLHPIPSTGGSAHINSNVSNIQKKRRQSQQAAAGSGNTKFISTKMNLLNYPNVQTLHPIPSAGGSAHVNSNVSNIQKKRRQSQQADTTIWLTIFPTNMVLRVNINQIEPATRDWICKVQIVEIGRPRESLDKKCTFQNLILEDEEECQIKAVMYTDEIEQYAATLKLLNTYLISTAKVKVSPTSYGKPIHKFHWILDKETVIEQIKASHEVEKPLPPPTKLNITSFDRIPHLMVDSAAEIDILAIVLRCGPQKNAGRSHHRCREITLCDNQRNQFLFTLWEDFGEIEGHEISSKMATEADLLVILGRSIGISTYQGLSLQTRYNSTVRVNPNYPQAVALINWAKENKTMLLGSPSEKTSAS
ncbi:hypothetical protein KY290_030352, partial [Solanum tuberosum]